MFHWPFILDRSAFYRLVFINYSGGMKAIETKCPFVEEAGGGEQTLLNIPSISKCVDTSKICVRVICCMLYVRVSVDDGCPCAERL